jgi:hypothetical protein
VGWPKLGDGGLLGSFNDLTSRSYPYSSLARDCEAWFASIPLPGNFGNWGAPLSGGVV